MICLILVRPRRRGEEKRWRGSKGMRKKRWCVCVCGMEICESVRWKRWAQSESERQRQRESVCLDQLHSKSVYSAQFGIKHNRLLSACYCLCCPIKMEFIAALRASPNYTFFPLCSVLLSLSFALFLFLQLWWWQCLQFLHHLSDKSERLITDPNRQVL